MQRIRRIPILLFYCWGSVLLLHGQHVKLSFHQITREQGLGYGTDYFVSTDRYGFVWIGTEEGLDRYDGQQIEHFAPHTGEVQVTSRCFEDNSGDLWFSTFSALHCYRRASARIQTFPTGRSELLDVHAFFMDPDQVLWLKAGSGDRGFLYRFDTNTGRYEQLGPLIGKRCTAIPDATGRLAQVVSTMLLQDAGMVITNLKTGTALKIQFDQLHDGEPRRASPTRNVHVDGDSILWVGIYNGLGKYRLKQGNAVTVVEREPAVAADVGWINDVVAYDANRLLVASNEGLLVFDKLQNRFIQQIRNRANMPHTLPAGGITQIYHDRFNQIWLSGPGGGIAFAHLFKTKFSSIPETAGTAVTGMYLGNNGRIWCSTADSGAYLFNRDAGLQLHSRVLNNRATPGEHFNLPAISAFWETGAGALWAFSENYAFQWSEQDRKFEFQEHNFFGVPSSESDHLRLHPPLSDATRLVSRGKEIFKLKTEGEWVSLLSWKDLYAIGLQQVTAIFQSRNGLLFVADNHYRIVALEMSGQEARKVNEWTNTGDCTSFLETGDRQLWAASSKGLFCINLKSMQGAFQTEASGGVPAERYYDVLQDKKGCLWLTGNNGLIRFDPASRTYHRFGTVDGLLSGIFSPQSALTIPKTGAIWLGSANGVNVFKPEDIQLLDVPSGVQLTRLLVNDTFFHTGQDLCRLEKLDLNYNQNTLSFQFAALDFSAPGRNLYYYRMKGIEKDSVSNGNRGFVRYSNLPAGNYTFEVWATNSDGRLSVQPRRVEVHIRPPFWQTWWFYLLSLATVAGLVYAWFQYRLRQALKIERMRVQISSDLHDDVGTLLSGLAMQSEVLELTAAEKDKGKLRRIGEISRDAMARMRDTVWAIDARKDKLENLLDRMREHAEETLTPRGIRFQLAVTSLHLKQNLSTEIRQNLYLIYKEAVTNTVKHTNGDTLTVSLTNTAAGLEMQVCDNGRVTEKSYKSTGAGLSNMQMRAQKIGGTLEIDTKNGFCVLLRLPGLSL